MPRNREAGDSSHSCYNTNATADWGNRGRLFFFFPSSRKRPNAAALNGGSGDAGARSVLVGLLLLITCPFPSHPPANPYPCCFSSAPEQPTTRQSNKPNSNRALGAADPSASRVSHSFSSRGGCQATHGPRRVSMRRAGACSVRFHSCPVQSSPARPVGAEPQLRLAAQGPPPPSAPCALGALAPGPGRRELPRRRIRRRTKSWSFKLKLLSLGAAPGWMPHLESGLVWRRGGKT